MSAIRTLELIYGKRKVPVFNSTTLTLEQALACECYGWYRNFWRNRIVELRKHPTDDKRVISIGYTPIEGKPNGLLTCETAGAVYVCDEEKNESKFTELTLYGRFCDYY